MTDEKSNPTKYTITWGTNFKAYTSTRKEALDVHNALVAIGWDNSRAFNTETAEEIV